jgi:hypothetical protein
MAVLFKHLLNLLFWGSFAIGIPTMMIYMGSIQFFEFSSPLEPNFLKGETIPFWVHKTVYISQRQRDMLDYCRYILFFAWPVFVFGGAIKALSRTGRSNRNSEKG